jgi:serine/threonine-protein kinase
MTLHGDYGILLGLLGRFRDAIAAIDKSAALFQAVGGPAPRDDPRYLNNRCDAANGLGDYAMAETDCELSQRLMRERFAEDDPNRLMVESNWARTLAFRGRFAESSALFDSVIERTAKRLGETAFPVGIHTFRAARAALLSDDRARADALIRRSQGVIDASFPAPHHWRGRIRRLRGLLAMAQGDPDTAQASFDEALIEFQGSLPPTHLLVAQVQANRAAVLAQRGHTAGAIALLEPALPILRELTLPQEVDRAAAEDLAKTLKLPAL